ncbi:MAG: hypothetical protein J6Z41_08975 [Prevotella sp.]|jgi:hypothetical protein|nr:hypothetical protein [Prevotella sp.]
MKKNYEKPSMKMTGVEVTSCLCNQSVKDVVSNVNLNPVINPGSGNARSRQSNVWDEEWTDDE